MCLTNAVWPHRDSTKPSTYTHDLHVDISRLQANRKVKINEFHNNGKKNCKVFFTYCSRQQLLAFHCFGNKNSGIPNILRLRYLSALKILDAHVSSWLSTQRHEKTLTSFCSAIQLHVVYTSVSTFLISRFYNFDSWPCTSADALTVLMFVSCMTSQENLCISRATIIFPPSLPGKCCLGTSAIAAPSKI